MTPGLPRRAWVRLRRVLAGSLAASLMLALIPAMALAESAPALSSIAPTSGPVGTTLTLSGSGFGTVAGSVYFTPSGSTIPVVVPAGTGETNTSATAVVPNSLSAGTVSVAVYNYTTGLLSASQNFTVTAAPALSSIAPTSGPVGTTLTLSGSGFGTVAGSVYFTQGSTTLKQAGSPWSGTSVSTTVPSGLSAGSVAVAVYNSTTGLLSNSQNFTVTAAPTLSSISPTSGPVGTTLTLSGSGFESPGTVAGSVYFTPSGTTPPVIVPAGSGETDTSATAVVPNSLSASPVAVAVYNATTGLLSNSLSFSLTCSGVSVTTGTFVVGPGQTTLTVPITTDVTSPGLAGYGLTLNYNPNVIIATNVSVGTNGWIPTVNLTGASQGTITLVAAQGSGSGVIGTQTLANVAFNVVGSVGQKTSITVTVTSFTNPQTLANYQTCPQIGEVTIVGAPADVTLTPSPRSVLTGEQVVLSGAVTDSAGDLLANQTVDLTTTGGILNVSSVNTLTTGGYSATLLAPKTAGPVTVTATVQGTTITASAGVTVTAAPVALSVTTTSLPGGTVGTAYTATLAATGGTTPYTWSVSSGSLPAGLSLDASTGVISGTPTAAGTSSFTVQATDSSSPAQTASADLVLIIAPVGVTVTGTTSGSTSNPNVPATAGGAGTNTPSITISASGGTGVVTVAGYNEDPRGTPTFNSAGVYFDAVVAPSSTFTTLTLTQCNLDGGTVVYWWNGTAWAAASDQSLSNGCVIVTVNATTSPNLSQLTGTVFAVGIAPTVQTVTGTQVGGFAPGSTSAGLTESTATVLPCPLPSGLGADSNAVVLSGTAPTTPQVFQLHYIAPPGRGVSVLALHAGCSWVFVPTTLNPSVDTASVFVTGPETLVVASNATQFTDVPSDFWARGAIETLAAANVINGFPNGTFEPNAAMTRAQFVKMLVLALGLAPGSGSTNFTDVPADAWYAPYVSAAVQAGLVTGMTATTFDPNATVTREDVAVLLARALKLSGTTTLTFSDSAQIAPWAISGVEAAVAAGYLNGFPDGTFQPAAPMTRAQAAKVLALVIGHMAP